MNNKPMATLSDRGPALDMSEFRRIGHDCIELLASYLEQIPENPVYRPMNDVERSDLADQPLSADGLRPDTIIADFENKILPFHMGNGHPRFFGWVNSAPAPMAIIAELLAAGQDPACDDRDIAAAYLEQAVVRWLTDLVGFPDSSMGLLVSGGSMATLTCLAVARQWAAETDGWNVREDGLQQAGRPRLISYTSAQGHSSIRKTVELLGLGSANLRAVPADDRFKMDPVRLAEMVAADRAAGHRPFCVIASAGTTNTGAVDPFAEIADVCAAEQLWLHVDGAYGALGVLHPELAGAYEGMNRADSLSLDPHKWLSVPIECGCALVTDHDLMRRTFSIVPPYLLAAEGRGVGAPASYAEYGFQQTRAFRALKLWMMMQHAGRRGITDLVTRTVGLARHLSDRVTDSPDLELVAPPELTVVCFRYQPPGSGLDQDEVDALNRSIEGKVQADGRAFLTSTELAGRFVLRASVLHYGTTRADVDVLISVVREAGAELSSRR
jgi:aromatic-L-amino-acid/L-tryptophan decarboxylase